MPEWKVRLLSASYDRNTVTIELFGKTDTGKGITVLYEGFRPYFYLVEPPVETMERFRRDPEYLKDDEVKLFVEGKDQRCVKVTVRSPWKVPQLREDYGRNCRYLAADIPFHHRFIYDMDLGACFTAVGDEVKNVNYTTELVVKVKDFKPCEPFKPALKIFSFDIENSIKDGTIYTICYAMHDGESMAGDSLSGTEKEILSGFEKAIQKHDPDIITGYNIDGYDIPQINAAVGRQGMWGLRLGRDYGQLQSVSERFWRLHGRLIADAWWNAKNQLHPKQETLNYVAKLLLGEEKDDVNRLDIDNEWKRDQARVINYCAKDADLALRILEKIKVLEKGMDLATVSKLPLDDIVNGRTSTMIDSILIRAADRNGIGVPLTNRSTDKEEIEGGYVHTIAPGLYHWVCVLDFKSMYPSLIISKNICFTTYSPKGTIVAPKTGARFLDKSQKPGLIPRILEDLMRQREDFKGKMKGAKNDAEKAYYDGLQYAIKILMNSFYGVFASTFYRFTIPIIGASITQFARDTITTVISTLEKSGSKVIYSDTDSVFLTSPSPGFENAKKFGDSVSEQFTKEGISLDLDRVFETMFSHGKKKRYAGKAVWPAQELIIRGYEMRRTDSFDLQSESLMTVFEKILANDIDGALSYAKETVAKTLAGTEIDLKKLVISRTCREFAFYKDPDSQVNVQVARKMLAMGYEFVPGMKVSWIVTDGKKTPQKAEPYMEGREFTGIPDNKYYAGRVAATIARATEVFGLDEEALLTGRKKSSVTLMDFGEDGSHAEKIKPSKLEDFM